jgi:hypothetical protein
MLDPVSIGLAISTASKAFDMIQRGFAVGRELEQMHGDMGRWMSATAEIAATAEDAENAGFITRMLKGSGNIESNCNSGCRWPKNKSKSNAMN